MALLLLSPVIIIITGLLKLDEGAIIFKQERVGFGGRRFQIFKLRSMVADVGKGGVQ